MLDQITVALLQFLLEFVTILTSLMIWCLFIWIILTYLVLFRAMRPDNPGFILFSQLARPILKPFRWARIGMIDLSPIVAFFVIQFVANTAIKAINYFLS